MTGSSCAASWAARINPAAPLRTAVLDGLTVERQPTRASTSAHRRRRDAGGAVRRDVGALAQEDFHATVLRAACVGGVLGDGLVLASAGRQDAPGIDAARGQVVAGGIGAPL